MSRSAIRLAGVLLALAVTACTHLAETQVAGETDILSRQILVTTRQQSMPGALSLVGDPASVYLRRRGYGPSPGVERLLEDIADDYDIRRVEGWPISSLGVYCEVFEIAGDQNLDEVLARLDTDLRVESVQAMNLYETQGIRYDDPLAAMQPALVDLAIDSAHESATGKGVRVAVVDSRVDHRHPEMRGRVPVRRDLAPGRRASQAEVHGTAVAGIIASMANNARGIVGVAPDAEIVSLRACWTADESTGRALCSSFSLARSIEIALDIGVDIVNLSLSGPRDPLLERLLDVAIREGVVIVAALPESGDAAGGFPASHPGVIAAVQDSGGPVHDNVLVAPGREVLTTLPGDGYAFFSGNSMASAFVTGVSALLIEKRPDISALAIVSVLSETATGNSINACRALAALSTDANACEPAGAGPVSAAISNRPR